MGPKKCRKNVRKTEVLTDTPTEFELGDTVADIQRRRREEREQRERERERERERGGKEITEGGEGEGGSHEGQGMAEKRPRIEKSDGEMDTDSGGKAGIAQLQSMCKKGLHMGTLCQFVF